MPWPNPLKKPVFLFLFLALLPGILVVPALLEKASNSIGITIRQEKPEDPVEIVRVFQNTPAENAGLRKGMVLRGALGQPIHNLDDVGRIWALRKPGQLLTVEVQQGDRPPILLHIKPGITPDFTPLLLNVLGGFFFLGLIHLLFPQRKEPQARVLLLMLVLLSTDFMLPYGYAGELEPWLWRFNLFNLIAVNLLALHFFMLFPHPMKVVRQHKSVVLLGIYGLLLPLGFSMAALVDDPTKNPSSFPVYTLDTLLALCSWTLLSIRTLNQRQDPERTLTRWVWLFFTPFALSKGLWYLQTYSGLNLNLPVDRLLQFATILAPTGFYLATLRLDYLQAGKRVRSHDLTLYLQIILLILILLLAQQIHDWVLAHERALATLAAVSTALIGGALSTPLSERMANWVMRGMFTRSGHMLQAIDRFFRQQLDTRDESQLMAEVAQFVHTKLHMPWVAIQFCAGLKEEDELIALSQPEPFAAQDFPRFLQGMDRFLNNPDKTPESTQQRDAWMKEFGILRIFPFCSASHAQGHLVVGQSSEQRRNLSAHEIKDLQDISQRLATVIERIQLEKTAQVDELTGALRREAGMIQLQLALESSQRKQQPLAVALLDLDHFKEVNDQYGHPVGDQVLRETAKLVRRQLRSSDVLCRYGGEEFLVILPATGKKGAAYALEKLLEVIRRHYIRFGKGEKSLNITLSAGCAVFQPEDWAPDDAYNLASKLIHAADQRLYEAKHHGRDRFYCRVLSPPQETVDQ